MNNDVENLLSSSGVGILILDENYEIRKFSPKIPVIFNILEKDIGRPIDHISHKIDGFNPLKAAQKVQKSNQQITFEFTAQDQTEYLIRILPYHIGPDTYAGSIFIFVDVTETKKVRQDLKDSQALSRDIVHYMPSGLYIYHLDSKKRLLLEDSNEKAEQLTGMRHEKIKGMPFQKIWPEAEKMGILDKFLNVVTSGDAVVLDDLKYGDENVSGHYRVTAFSLPNDRLAVVFDDITIHEKLWQRLGETEIKYNTLFEKISQGVVYQDKGGKLFQPIRLRSRFWD